MIFPKKKHENKFSAETPSRELMQTIKIEIPLLKEMVVVYLCRFLQDDIMISTTSILGATSVAGLITVGVKKTRTH